MKDHRFKYRHLPDAQDLSTGEKNLIQAAKVVASKAYAPYSGFKVGASALLGDGTIVVASNMENVAYPQCLCAEQVLLSTIKSQYEDRAVLKLAVHSPDWKEKMPLSPCGSCRQILLEKERRQKRDLSIFLLNAKGEIWAISSVADLLPFAFK